MEKIFSVFMIYDEGDSYTTFKLIGNSKSMDGAYCIVSRYIENRGSIYQRVIEKIKSQDSLEASISIELTNEEKQEGYRDNTYNYKLLPEMMPGNNFAMVSTREEVEQSLGFIDYNDVFNGFLIEEGKLFD